MRKLRPQTGNDLAATTQPKEPPEPPSNERRNENCAQNLSWCHIPAALTRKHSISVCGMYEVRGDEGAKKEKEEIGNKREARAVNDPRPVSVSLQL